jgi:thioredoxin 1
MSTTNIATTATATPTAREIEEHEFDATVRPERLTVVDFSASWCGPCRRLEPILGELAAELPDVDFLKVDADRSQQLAIRYGVQAVPTLLVLRSGQVVDRLVGIWQMGLFEV